ncbi:MAG: RNA 2',3'-cyclic phosphodiesterase [Candidatus Micrarchaeota archaeon]
MRLFLAVEIPEEIRAKLETTVLDARRLGIPASFSKTDQLHITLLFLGEKTDAQLAEIRGKLSGLNSQKFKMFIQGAGFFPSDRFIRVFWAGAQDSYGELHALHTQVCTLLDSRPEPNYAGHITLARVKSPDNLQSLRDLRRTLEGVQFGEFTVSEIVLKKSTLTPEGAAYEDLNTFPLK